MNQLLNTTKIPIWDGSTTCLSKIIKQNILFKEYNQIINTFKANNESDILKLFEIDKYNITLIKKIHLLNHTTQLYSISEMMYMNLHTSTHFCCIILNHSSIEKQYSY